MNAINMPLSVVGLEGVWYNTLLRFGFTDEEARSFLTGPGILPGNGCKISRVMADRFRSPG